MPASPTLPASPQAETGPEPKVELRSWTFSALPGWSSDKHGEALAAFQKSCARMMTLPHNRNVAANDAAPGGMVQNWQGPCGAAKTVSVGDHAQAKRFFETWFVPYEVADVGDPEGLFTGYYEPELNGAWNRGGPYQTALYARPDDLVSVSLGAFDDELGGNTIWGQVSDGKLVPYADRARIEAGEVKGLRPLLWVDDPVDAFFLHVQGSGLVKLSDGSFVRVGFAGKNGRTYKSIGRVLIDSGEIPADRLTMDAIRDWVHARPVAGPELLRKNPSYVFFRLLDGIGDGDGPLGAQGVSLTSGRSLAVDRRYLPLGAPLWLMTHDPLDANRPFQRLMIAQDTGGAIRGVVRGDIFFGHGADAGKRAGNMKRPGRYFILLPLSVVPTLADNR
ncbi:murein transglycosylase A [Magnetovibrio sp.]|uniref:murein transglycosylase A n=1 Tax=Magnetovibrio sp. TaxID=2024836 RepID=UPI002F946B5F